MNAKISKINKQPKKHHSPWFANKYPREIRGNNNLNTDNISEDMKKFYPSGIENTVYAITDESPFEDYNYYKELDLSDAVINFNSMLIYRLLKLMCGVPDVLGAFIDNQIPDNIKVAPGDWGYILRLDNNIIAEIRSLFTNTKHAVRIWVPETNHNEKEAGIISQFGKDLNKAISNNLHLFSEKEELKKATDNITCTFENSFAITLKSAESFFNIAQSIDKKPEKMTLQWCEKPEVRTVGSIYMASALFYIIAMETLLNIFYKIFLDDKYKQYPYARVTNKADLEIRLSTMHLFCRCFARQVVPPKSELWKKISLLRDFRNDIVHGNITNEHYAHTLVEDSMLFYYSSIIDFSGLLEESKQIDSFPRVMSSIGEKEVVSIKNIINDLIQSLLDAMDDEPRTWVKSWLYELVIPEKDYNN